jgi:hypothetical protein
MSQENVEIVRGAFDSVNRGDIDGALENAADDFEVDWSNSIGPAKGIYSGKEQVREYWASSADAGALSGRTQTAPSLPEQTWVQRSLRRWLVAHAMASATSSVGRRRGLPLAL